MPRALALMLGLAVLGACSIEAPPEASAGGGGAPAVVAPPAAPVAPPAPTAVDVEALSAKAKADLLKSLGLGSEDEAKAIVEAARKAEEARMSEGEKVVKALAKAQKDKDAAEAAAQANADKIASLEAAALMRDKLDELGAAPKSRPMVEVMYIAAKAAKGAKFDEAEFVAELKKEHPTLFAGAAPAASAALVPANTAPTFVPAGLGHAAAQGAELPNSLATRPRANRYS